MVDLKLLTIPIIAGLIQQEIESFYGRVIRIMVLDAESSWLLLLMRPRFRGRIARRRDNVRERVAGAGVRDGADQLWL